MQICSSKIVLKSAHRAHFLFAESSISIVKIAYLFCYDVKFTHSRNSNKTILFTKPNLQNQTKIFRNYLQKFKFILYFKKSSEMIYKIYLTSRTRGHTKGGHKRKLPYIKVYWRVIAVTK